MRILIQENLLLVRLLTFFTLSCLCNRLTGDKKGDKKDESLDTVIQYHQNMQENIAEEMIKMAQNLKHSSVVASNIIKEDNKVRCVLFKEILHRSAMGAKCGTKRTEIESKD